MYSHLPWTWGLHGGSVLRIHLQCRSRTCNAGAVGSIPGSEGSPGGGHGNLFQYFLPGESHGQRSLVGYSLQNHKESDTTEVT